jgi:hypothetical protein
MDYCQVMKNNKIHFFKTNKAGLVLGAVLVGTLTYCVGYADQPHVGISVSLPVVVAPVVVAPVVAAPVVVPDDYIYYPSYGVYYNSSRHQYAYLKDGAWLYQPAPEGVTVDVLQASPSVHMDFHDSPEKHHAEMVQKYPRNWKSGGDHQDHPDKK